MKNKVLKNLPLYFFFGCLTFSLFFLVSGCQKDEVEIKTVTSEIIDTTSNSQVSPRTGTVDTIFFRTSLTTDNYLLNTTRSYQIYNKAKVKEIKFTSTSLPLINVNGVLLRHYDILITFTDLSTKQLTAYSKSNLTSFTFIPVGVNLLRDQHSAKFLEISEASSSNGYVYNFWRDITAVSKVWNVRKDGTILVVTKPLDPLDRNSNIFSPPHTH